MSHTHSTLQWSRAEHTEWKLKIVKHSPCLLLRQKYGESRRESAHLGCAHTVAATAKEDVSHSILNSISGHWQKSQEKSPGSRCNGSRYEKAGMENNPGTEVGTEIRLVSACEISLQASLAETMTSYSHLCKTDIGTKWHLLKWLPEGPASQKANICQVPFLQVALSHLQRDVQCTRGH